mgnify:CR=1 FL=1
MNPCRCGYLSDPERACTRAPKCAVDYQSKLSGPLIDRIDLHGPHPEPEAQLSCLVRFTEVNETDARGNVDLVRDGFDPRKVSDPIYFRDPALGRYVRLDAGLCDAILSGQTRL